MITNTEIVNIAQKEIQAAGICIKEILGREVYRHSLNTCRISLRIATEFEFNLQEKIDLAMGALLHDIGKSCVSQEILNKEETLTKDDRMLIECHPQQGYLYLKPFKFNQKVLDIVHYHHERLNGDGYPESLNKKQIDILVQIVSVADVYDALTSDRVYHKAKTPETAFKILEDDNGLNQIVVKILKNTYNLL